jgi:hypothetical protein
LFEDLTHIFVADIGSKVGHMHGVTRNLTHNEYNAKR